MSLADLLALARAVPECGGMERFLAACTPATIAALCERLRHLTNLLGLELSGTIEEHQARTMTTPLLRPAERENEV